MQKNRPAAADLHFDERLRCTALPPLIPAALAGSLRRAHLGGGDQPRVRGGQVNAALLNAANDPLPADGYNGFQEARGEAFYSCRDGAGKYTTVTYSVLAETGEVQAAASAPAAVSRAQGQTAGSSWSQHFCRPFAAFWIVCPSYNVTVFAPHVVHGRRPVLQRVGELGIKRCVEAALHDVSQGNHVVVVKANLGKPERVRPGLRSSNERLDELCPVRGRNKSHRVLPLSPPTGGCSELMVSL